MVILDHDYYRKLTLAVILEPSMTSKDFFIILEPFINTLDVHNYVSRR